MENNDKAQKVLDQIMKEDDRDIDSPLWQELKQLLQNDLSEALLRVYSKVPKED